MVTTRAAYIYQECSAESDLLDEALAKAQGEFKKVLRNREGPYGKFADLSAMEDATKPALAKYALSVRQTFVTHDDRSMTLVTRLSCQGQFCISAIPIPFFSNPQHTHSYCTYMARLGYSRVLCLSVDDASDGEDIPTEPAASNPGPDIDAIKGAFQTAATVERLEALWARVGELSLTKAQKAEVTKVFEQQMARLAKAAKKEAQNDSPK